MTRGLSALGLVVNIIVLWNTIYIDAALDQLREKGYLVRDDTARTQSVIASSYAGEEETVVPEVVDCGNAADRAVGQHQGR